MTLDELTGDPEYRALVAAAVRRVVSSTLAYYVGVVEALADEADGDDTGETRH